MIKPHTGVCPRALQSRQHACVWYDNAHIRLVLPLLCRVPLRIPFSLIVAVAIIDRGDTRFDVIHDLPYSEPGDAHSGHHACRCAPQVMVSKIYPRRCMNSLESLLRIGHWSVASRKWFFLLSKAPCQGPHFFNYPQSEWRQRYSVCRSILCFDSCR